MGKNSKKFDEQLQEVRSKNHNKIRYRKRIQEESEADKELRDWALQELRRLSDEMGEEL